MLYTKIKDFTPFDTTYFTDYFEPYTKFIPKENHRQGKDQTYTVEGYNASFRDDLRRLTRRTRAYSKSKASLDSSIYLYIQSHNNKKLKKLGCEGVY